VVLSHQLQCLARSQPPTTNTNQCAVAAEETIPEKELNLDPEAKLHCTRCNRFYRHGDNNSTACTFHPGQYKSNGSRFPVHRVCQPNTYPAATPPTDKRCASSTRMELVGCIDVQSGHVAKTWQRMHRHAVSAVIGH
jgi:hypothetical protein